MGRRAALGDGVFAIAMRLPMFDLKIPPKEAFHGGVQLLWVALIALAPQTIAYLKSFLTPGIFWVGSKPSSASSVNRSEAWFANRGSFCVKFPCWLPFAVGVIRSSPKPTPIENRTSNQPRINNIQATHKKSPSAGPASVHQITQWNQQLDSKTLDTRMV